MVSLNDILALFLGRFLPVDAILSYGSVRQDWKNKAVLMLKERALCCLKHGSRPSDWVFSFKQMFGPPNLIANHGGAPFWAMCYQCKPCGDLHFQGVQDGHEEVVRNLALQQFPLAYSYPHILSRSG